MCFDDIAVNVHGLSKCFQVYAAPEDRLKQFIAPRLQRMIGKPEKQYFREFWALKDVSFIIKKGETLGILGLNGAGKSTLLQIIAGTVSPTSGKLQVEGRVSALLELGAGFNPEFSGQENIFLYASLLGLNRNEIELNYPSIVDFAAIGDYINMPVSTYSSGMYARLAFAIAIHVNPEILIVDEALAVGDIFFQQKCFAYLKNKFKNKTKIIVTHDLNAVAHFADRIIILHNGQVHFDGDPTAGIKAYYGLSQGGLSGEDLDKKSNITADDQNNALEDLNFLPVRPSKLTGIGKVCIVGFNIQINNKSANSVSGGDHVEILIKLNANAITNRRGVIGFFFRDKLNNMVIAQNTLASPRFKAEFIPGLNYVNVSFIWPFLRNGEYTLTLGIGEVDWANIDDHTVQCWAHDVAVLHSSASIYHDALISVENVEWNILNTISTQTYSSV